MRQVPVTNRTISVYHMLPLLPYNNMNNPFVSLSPEFSQWLFDQLQSEVGSIGDNAPDSEWVVAYTNTFYALMGR